LGQEFGGNFAKAITNSLKQDGQLDLTEVFTEISPEEYAKISKMSDEDLTKLFGITPEVLKQSAYKTVDGWLDAFRE
jgi:hypothetical protein